MQFKLIIRLVEKLLKLKTDQDEPRADLYLSEFSLKIGLALILGGVCLAIVFAFAHKAWMICLSIMVILFGTIAIMCWRNQSINIISDDKFKYTTFLGNTYEYCFKDIAGFRQNRDSITLFVGDKKVHIDSTAVLSKKLLDKLNSIFGTDK